MGDGLDYSGGQTTTTRVGNTTYMDVVNTVMYAAESISTYPRQINLKTKSFHVGIYLQSTINTSFNLIPSYDIYIPGNNNFTFTLVPVVSTIV